MIRTRVQAAGIAGHIEMGAADDSELAELLDSMRILAREVRLLYLAQRNGPSS
jgi:hypothetical protein